MSTLLKNGFLTDENGKAFMPIGLQAHNSSTGTVLFDQVIAAVKEFHGNCIETPVYWYLVEPEMDQYEFAHVKEAIDKTRAAGLKLIFLWFGTSKNGHPNYVPEYVKLDPKTYELTIGSDGAAVASMSPHCMATLERDKKAFAALMGFLKEYDEKERTVIAVQVENEMGFSNTDMDYGKTALKQYMEEVPESLQGIFLEDDGREQLANLSSEELKCLSPWKKQFGRHAHEVFASWYHAQYINAIAEAGKAVYELPMTINVMVGENAYEEPGLCYNSGAAVTRMLDIWKAGAPAIDLIGPDIYNQNRLEYRRICEGYKRDDNPLFIPESPMGGDANAMNAILAVGEYEAVGICCFGAESALAKSGCDGAVTVRERSKDICLSMRTIRALEPLLIKYHGSGKIHAFAEDEFETRHYLKLKNYHVVANYLRHKEMNIGGSPAVFEEERNVRGRGILIQTGEREFYLAGAGIALDFIRRPEVKDEKSYSHLSSRMHGQLNFLSVEEGHFEGDTWVVDFRRNGDETNFSQYVLGGQVIRIRLNVTPF